MMPEINQQQANSTESKLIQKSVKPSLWEEVQKGWQWVVFSTKMLGRMGGPVSIVQTLGGTLGILIQRTLRQWFGKK